MFRPNIYINIRKWTCFYINIHLYGNRNTYLHYRLPDSKRCINVLSFGGSVPNKNGLLFCFVPTSLYFCIKSFMP